MFEPNTFDDFKNIAKWLSQILSWPECNSWILKAVFDDNTLAQVQFEKWIGTDRFTIQLLPPDDFVDSLCDALDTFKPHA